MDPTQIAALKDWLARQALLGTPAAQIVTRAGEAFNAAGLSLSRLHVGMDALHPQVESIGATWRRAASVQEEAYAHGAFAAIAGESPLFEAVSRARAGSGDPHSFPMTRYRLDAGEGLEMALLRQFRAEGASDYVCFILAFGVDGRVRTGARGAAVSFCTDRAGGFTEEEIAAMQAVLPALGAALRTAAQAAILSSLIDTYLGREVGRRVLNGEVRRGAVETIEAAILIADLRGFTALADETPGAALTVMLDAYLDCAVGAVEGAGGNVLKFLGDGLIATFAFAREGAGQACAQALAAAARIEADSGAISAARAAAGAPHSRFDLALHAGAVLFGNVGAARRLDFTIVGPAVNEAARLETLCAPLGAPILASRAFVAASATPERFVSLGEHALKGVRAPIEVFAPV